MVVIADPTRDKTPALLRAVGRAIESLGGKYITGEDVGTTAADMAAVRETTAKVMGLPENLGGSGDPSPSTALGCFVGIEASLAHALGRRSVEGVRVAVQGLGNVGYNLCKRLADAGARLTVADPSASAVAKCVEEFGAAAVKPDAIYAAEVDVFSPCALGAVLNDKTLPMLRAKVVAGAANNQLATTRIGHQLRHRGILYAPDYVINAGGMIQLAAELTDIGETEVEQRVRAIHDTLLIVYRSAAAERLPESEAAERMARARLAARATSEID
jgi:leucine dehydrogenase